jgi:hypothetical protein
MSDIAERVAAWRATSDTARLWPDVPPAARQEAQRSIARVTRERLGSATAVSRMEVAGTLERRALGIQAYLSGMGPHLGRWVEEGTLAADPDTDTVLRQHLAEGRARHQRLGRALDSVVSALNAGGIRPIVLKGAHTARAFFPEPGTRPAGDIDLLVPPHTVTAVTEALSQLGFREVTPPTAIHPRSEWMHADTRSLPLSLDMEHADDPWKVDLHTELERYYHRGLRVRLGNGAFDTRRQLPIAGSAFVLEQPYLATFLALHAGYDIPNIRLIRVVELVLMLRAEAGSGRLVWSEWAEFLRRRALLSVVTPALLLAERLVPGSLSPDLHGMLVTDSPARVRRVVAKIVAAGWGGPWRWSLDQQLIWCRGARGVALQVLEWVWPPGVPGGLRGIAAMQWRRVRLLGSRTGSR